MAKRMTDEQKVILTDAGIFAAKLWVDGLKDLVLAVVCLGAALIDVMRGRGPQGYLFYRVMRFSRHVDEVLDLYGVPEPPAELDPQKAAEEPTTQPHTDS